MSRFIPQAFIEDLLTRVDIVEIVDSRVPLKKVGVNFKANCPFHSEKTPSFTVSPRKQIYHCFGCLVGGNSISFLMEYDRMEFVEAIHSLAKHAGVEVPQDGDAPKKPAVSKSLYPLLDKIAGHYQKQLKNHPKASAAKDYLKGRGLTGEITKKFSVGFAPPGWDNLLSLSKKSPKTINKLLNSGMLIKKDDGKMYDRFRDRIMFPIRDHRGRVIGFGGRVLGDDTPKYLNSPETPAFHKSKELYGLFEALQASRNLPRVLIVEGYMDVIALAQHGFENAVATMGTAITPDHLSRLFRYVNEIVFCFDGDKAGKAAAWRALENTLLQMEDGRQARFMFLPEGDDPDSFVRNNGSEAFQKEIDNATPLSEFFFNHLSAQVDMSSMDGRAGLAKIATPMIEKISSGVFKHMMLERLAQLVRINLKTLHSLSKKPVRRAKKSTVPQRKRSAQQRARTPSPIRLAVALLLQYPELAKGVEGVEQIILLKSPGIKLFGEIVDVLKESPELNSQTLIERWRNKEDYRQLVTLVAWDHSVPEEGIEAEFQGALQRLRQLNREQKVDALMKKAKIEGLSTEEKVALQALLAK